MYLGYEFHSDQDIDYRIKMRIIYILPESVYDKVVFAKKFCDTITLKMTTLSL